jgi:glycosyltransferase involved in cell wall biosynthesis
VSKPTLTVILPVRNGEKFIADAIASVLNQTFGEFELWVLENGSDDSTVQIVKSINDRRLKLLELGPVGIQGALRYAIENAPSKWLARMDADDLMFPDRLQFQMNFLKQNPACVFVGTAYAILTPFGHILELPTRGYREVTKRELAGRRGFPDSSITFNRLAARDAGGVDTEFKKCDGLPLMFRLLTQGQAWSLGEHLQIYRLRPQSLSRNEDHDEESQKIHFKYAPEFFTPKLAKRPPQSFWRYIADLELLSGDLKTMRHALDNMKREGPYESEANGFPFKMPLGPLGRAYYRWRCRNGYRHRPDWEKLFSPFLKTSVPLSLAELTANIS